VIAKQTTIKLNDMQQKALGEYAARKSCNTTQAAVSTLINDLPDFKELEAESLASSHSVPSHKTYDGKSESQAEKSVAGEKVQQHEPAA